MKKTLLIAPFALSLLLLANKGHKEFNIDLLDESSVDYENIYDLATPCNCPSCLAIRQIGSEIDKSVVDKIDDKTLKNISENF